MGFKGSSRETEDRRAADWHERLEKHKTQLEMLCRGYLLTLYRVCWQSDAISEDTPEFPPLMLDATPKPFIVRTEISDTPIEVVQTSSDPEAIMVQTSRDYLFSVQVEITFHPDLVAEAAISEATRLNIIIRMSGELPVLQEDLHPPHVWWANAL